MTQALQPNAFAAGLRRALDIVRDQDELRAKVFEGIADPLRVRESQCAAHYMANILDALADQLLDAGGFLGDAPEPEERAYIMDGNGAVMASYTVDELDPDIYAEQFARDQGFEIDETDGAIPDGGEDFSVKIAEAPNSVRCWTSRNYMIKAEA